MIFLISFLFASDPLTFKCTDMGESLYRCENSEVICYKFKKREYGPAAYGGLSCVWKDKK